MLTKTSVEIIKSLDKINKDRSYFHDTNSDVLCEVITRGAVTAIQSKAREVSDISNSLEAIIVDDGLTRLTLVFDPTSVSIGNINVGDVARVSVENKRYTKRKGYIVVVNGEVAEDGLGQFVSI